MVLPLSAHLLYDAADADAERRVQLRQAGSVHVNLRVHDTAVQRRPRDTQQTRTDTGQSRNTPAAQWSPSPASGDEGPAAAT